MSTLLLPEPSTQEPASLLVRRMRESFASGRTRPLEARQRQLSGIRRFLKERESEIETALHDDMGRPSFEVFPSEIAFIGAELALASRKLRKWAKPERVFTSLAGQPGTSWIHREPLGVVLIIGP